MTICEQKREKREEEKGDEERASRKRKRKGWMHNRRWRWKTRCVDAKTSISGVVIFSMGGKREREIVCRELSKNNETGTKVGTGRKGREERDRFGGERRWNARAGTRREEKRGTKVVSLLSALLYSPRTHPFLPSQLISKLLRSFQTRTYSITILVAKSNPPVFFEIKKFFTRRNYFNAFVRRVYLLHV